MNKGPSSYWLRLVFASLVIYTTCTNRWAGLNRQRCGSRRWSSSAEAVFSHTIKGALCRILTLLKHKNSIICLHIFKKHAKLTYLFIWRTMLQSVILLWKCAFRAGMSVYVLVCETRPLPVYPIVFRHPGLPVGGREHISTIQVCMC